MNPKSVTFYAGMFKKGVRQGGDLERTAGENSFSGSYADNKTFQTDPTTSTAKSKRHLPEPKLSMSGVKLPATHGRPVDFRKLGLSLEKPTRPFVIERGKTEKRINRKPLGSDWAEKTEPQLPLNVQLQFHKVASEIARFRPSALPVSQQRFFQRKPSEIFGRSQEWVSRVVVAQPPENRTLAQNFLHLGQTTQRQRSQVVEKSEQILGKLDTLAVQKAQAHRFFGISSRDPIKIKTKYKHISDQEISQAENVPPKPSELIPSQAEPHASAKPLDQKAIFRVLRLQKAFQMIRKLMIRNQKAHAFQAVATSGRKRAAALRVREIFNYLMTKNLYHFVVAKEHYEHSVQVGQGVVRLDSLFRRNLWTSRRSAFSALRNHVSAQQRRQVRQMRSIFLHQGLKAVCNLFRGRKKEYGHIFLAFLEAHTQIKKARREVELKGSLHAIDAFMKETKKGFLKRSFGAIKEKRSRLQLLEICLHRLERLKASDKRLCLTRLRLLNQFVKSHRPHRLPGRFKLNF